MLSAGKMEERNGKKFNQVWNMIQSVKMLTHEVWHHELLPGAHINEGEKRSL